MVAHEQKGWSDILSAIAKLLVTFKNISANNEIPQLQGAKNDIILDC